MVWILLYAAIGVGCGAFFVLRWTLPESIGE